MKASLLNSKIITLASGESARHIAVHISGQVLWLAACEITHLRGEGNYTYVYTRQGKKYLVSKTMKNVQEALRADFMRVHKSYIVNPEFVTARLDADLLLLSCGHKVPIARRRIREIGELLAVEYLAVG
ncbi:LytR/AlgR family response regulator transcription factor [Dyadobacter bucti]|uniref:LytR/AlgR family response regulator transcription factor n=1 Tax=Dyadobacter bucti TaxID=2572203 RepID=UPI001109FD33|nr:LytTR family DNA-binding domain-containing protein [Dyadobacter bucti]